MALGRLQTEADLSRWLAQELARRPKPAPKFRAARVKHSADQTIANNNAISLAWDTEEYDTATLHDTSTNNERLTASVAGVYAVGACVEWGTNATGIRQLVLRKNGTTVLCTNRGQAITESGQQNAQVVSEQIFLEVGDYVEARVKQTSGGNLNIRTLTAGGAFYMCYLGRLPGP